MDSTTAPDPFEAERFELQGEGINLVYMATQGPRPLRRMTLVDRDGERRFYQGGDLDVEETRAGTMVTVVTRFVFDGDTHLLSVLLPNVNLADEGTADITTVAIRTVHRGHFGGPGFIDGALATHEAVALTGTAGEQGAQKRWSCSNWEAWYNDMLGPGAPDPTLRVSAKCSFASGSIKWSLEPTNEGILDDPERLVLRFEVEDPGAGDRRFVETTIGWSGDVGRGIKFVEIRGDVQLEIKVASRV